MSKQITIAAGAEPGEPEEVQLTDESCSIVVEESGQAIVWLTIAGEVTVVVSVADNAYVTVVCVQTEAATLTQRATVGAGATINWQNISLAPGQSVLQSTLSGAEATSNVDWMTYATGDEAVSLQAENVFNGAEGRGEISMQAVAQDTASVQMNGMINIGLGGRGTDTYLTEEVLMLDPTAKVNAVPGLEIKTNDVKASHSATVSKVTEEDVFYFAARGIPEAEARQMYVQGFLGDMTKGMPEEIVASITQALDAKWVIG